MSEMQIYANDDFAYIAKLPKKLTELGSAKKIKERLEENGFEDGYSYSPVQDSVYKYRNKPGEYLEPQNENAILEIVKDELEILSQKRFNLLVYNVVGAKITNSVDLSNTKLEDRSYIALANIGNIVSLEITPRIVDNTKDIYEPTTIKLGSREVMILSRKTLLNYEYFFRKKGTIVTGVLASQISVNSMDRLVSMSPSTSMGTKTQNKGKKMANVKFVIPPAKNPTKISKPSKLNIRKLDVKGNLSNPLRDLTPNEYTVVLQKRSKDIQDGYLPFVAIGNEINPFKIAEKEFLLARTNEEVANKLNYIKIQRYRVSENKTVTIPLGKILYKN